MSNDTAAVPPLAAEDHVCPGCTITYSSLTVATALEIITEAPARVRTATDGIAPQLWCTRPARGTWSVTEYVCHLRDVFAVSTIRLHRTRTEHRPALEPMLNDLRARRFRYNDLDLASVLTELAHNGSGLLDEAARFAEQDWERVATRRPGETRTARWLLRNAAHEARHHTRDIIAVGAAARGG